MAQSKSKRKKVDKSAYELPPPELVVVVHPEAGLRAGPEELAAEAADAAPLAEAIGSASAELTPLFGASEQRLRVEAAASAAQTGIASPDLSIYYQAEGAKDPAALAEELAGLDIVETAYVKPPAEPPAMLTDLAPLAAEPPTTTPDFSSHQGYLDAAPGGVDARYAWGRPGGDGAGVRIVDVEGAWRFTHEDLGGNQGGVIGGSMSTDIGWRNHGTAVAGEFSGDTNAFGVTGISPAANLRTVSIFGPGMGSGQAIRQAANALSAGDIILIELHRPGPRNNFQERGDQLGYIAVEWWPDDFDAILYATSRGVIVVEAGGNGAENLDDAVYNKPGPGFPASWTNPFNRANRDSGAIVVGAGAPPPGTHGRDHGPDRSRLDFSNYGALIDAQGWGREVTTCGYGDLQGGAGEDVWYTDQFSGTSSASPIVVGTLASLQGFSRARGRTLTPADCRSYLRQTGSPQQASPSAPVSQRIGNRPDLLSLFRAVEGITKGWGRGKEIKEKREGKEKFEKVEGKEKFEAKEAKNEKLEIEGKLKIKKEKDGKEKGEVEGGLGGGKLQVEAGGKLNLGQQVERLRAPGFNERIIDVKDEAKEKIEKPEKWEKDETGEKEKHEKDEKAEKEKSEKEEKFEKPEKPEWDEKDLQSEKTVKDDKETKDEKAEKPERSEKTEKSEKGERAEKAAKEKADKNEKLEVKEQPDKREPEFIFRRDDKIAREGVHGFDRGEVERSGSMQQRIGRLEALVSHFISPQFRPDLSEGALTHESDVSKLEGEAAQAKQSKDAKDVEKATEV